MVDDLADLHRDVVADELLGHERPDGVGAPDLAAVVVDVGVGGEGGDDPLGVEGVHGGDVLGDDGGQFGDHGQVLPVRVWPAIGAGEIHPRRSLHGRVNRRARP